MKTEEIVRSLRWCGTGTEENCGGCAFEPQCDEDAVGCVGGLCDAAADKIEELLDRCARYAEEIAALRERGTRNGRDALDGYPGGGVMERLTNKREADAQREGYERRLANGYQRSIPVERFLRLAAYEDSGRAPEEVSALIKDWIRLCTTIRECGGIDRLRVLAEADKDGRLVVLPDVPEVE